MADCILLKSAAMRGELLRYPWRVLARILKLSALPIFFRANPHLNFAPREIDKITVGKEVEVTLNFMGLQGASTPLPIHFSEAIIQDDPDDSNLNEFYNFFNQRTYTLLMAIEQKYAYLPQVSKDHGDALTTKLGRFAGFLGEEAQEKALLPFLGGLAGTNLSKGAWCRMVAGFIKAERAWVVERVPTRIQIPTEALASLGQNSSLGQTLSLGAYITQAKNHLELHLAIEELGVFLPNQAKFISLQTLVRETLRENMFVSVVLHAKKAATARLSRSQPIGLGWSSMLGHEQIESYGVRLHL